MNGITFNGIHHTAFNGLHFITSRRPLLPENKDTYVDIPYKDGSILIPDHSLKDVNVEVDFTLQCGSTQELYNVARQIGAWLNTNNRAPLIFDDDPSYPYMGKVTSSLTLEQLADFEEIAEFTVVFRCLPYSAN